MKNKIKQAGFHNKKQFGEFVDVTPDTVYKWEHKRPVWVDELLDARIKIKELVVENSFLNESLDRFCDTINRKNKEIEKLKTSKEGEL